MATEEEENLPIADELASHSFEKQTLGLQHIVLLAEANKDVAFYFSQICSVRLSPLPPLPHFFLLSSIELIPSLHNSFALQLSHL
jgi:hypothetical protein